MQTVTFDAKKLNETTIEALNTAKNRIVFEKENLFSSSKEMFNAFDA